MQKQRLFFLIPSFFSSSSSLFFSFFVTFLNLMSRSDVKSEDMQLTISNSISQNNVDQLKEKDLPKEVIPTFIFETKYDNTHFSPEPHKPFLCVYEFCVALEVFCKSKNIDIEKHWAKLLLKTTAHNYERFMWIHLHLINQPKLKLSWQQVVQRLMLKYDDPRRTQAVKRALNMFTFNPNIKPESIDAANRRFTAYVHETHCDPSEAIRLYLKGMPTLCRELLELTMAYDRHTGFNYCLNDIVQRASVFINAKSDDFIFYSKTVRIAVSLPLDKVQSNLCEFHITSSHTTAECPDYTILKYPYLSSMSVENEFCKIYQQVKALEPIKDQANMTTNKTTVQHTDPAVRPSYIPDLLPTSDASIKQEESSAETPRQVQCSQSKSSSSRPSKPCHFCRQPFYPGHLFECEVVRKKKRKTER
ncbi:hypothetical protein RMCBS344292_00997 [Rhizopus microsporus]|nr:hypothetical protein RMCBS344292_00997 [Rhizopus microsporus]